jgi:hypothetical protein
MSGAIDVPPELRAAFEDALNRLCFRCEHQVRNHVSTSDCGCCKKGLKMPSKQLEEMFQALQQAKDRVSEVFGGRQ